MRSLCLLSVAAGEIKKTNKQNQNQNQTKDTIFCGFNPVQPNISIHKLHTVLYTFHKMLTKRNNLELLVLVIISFIFVT